MVFLLKFDLNKKLVIVGFNYVEDSYVVILKSLVSENVIFVGIWKG